MRVEPNACRHRVAKCFNYINFGCGLGPLQARCARNWHSLCVATFSTMRIAIISTPFVPVPPHKYGGTELIVYELVEGLVAQGHDVTLYATGDSRVSAKLRHLYPKAVWPPNAFNELNHVSWAMSEILADGDFDAIHTHSALALPYTRMFPDLPMVYTMHHARDPEFSEFYANFATSMFIAISANQKRQEIPLKHCEVIHHGLNANNFLWSPTAQDYVCFLGRFARIKGPDTAIDVAEKAGLRIKVAGEAHSCDREYVEKEVLPRLKRPHVEYMGCLGLKGKRPLLQHARALLAPIAWEEPFGLFMIEAMLSGCPVVAFRRGSVPEIVDQGVTGFIVDDFDQMVEIIRPGGVLDAFDRRQCREHAVTRFNRDRLIASHERLYSKIVRSNQARDVIVLPELLQRA